MKTNTSRGGLRAGLVLLVLTAVLCCTVISASAANGLEMSTAYPGMHVNAGDSLSFALDFDSTLTTGESVALSVASIPDGWSGKFLGSSNEIDQVYVRTGENTGSATFELEVPDDAAEGTYTISLQATSESGAADTLNLSLFVTEEETGASSFTAQYPEQEGSSSTSFSFSTTLVNNSLSEQTYSLTSNAPSGWSVTFQPSGASTQVASLTVEPQQSQTITVTVTPPATVEAGEYDISCSAISASDTLTTDLSVTINDSYSVDLSTASGLLSADAQVNKETALTLTLTNNSNVDLQNLNLTSSAPDGWTVTFSESTVELLEAGSTKEVTAYVTPSSEALSGDYVVTITAQNSEATDTAEFRISVQTSTVWGIVGVVLILAVVGCLVWMFRKYGRR